MNVNNAKIHKWQEERGNMKENKGLGWFLKALILNPNNFKAPYLFNEIILYTNWICLNVQYVLFTKPKKPWCIDPEQDIDVNHSSKIPSFTNVLYLMSA